MLPTIGNIGLNKIQRTGKQQITFKAEKTRREENRKNGLSEARQKSAKSNGIVENTSDRKIELISKRIYERTENENGTHFVLGRWLNEWMTMLCMAELEWKRKRMRK